MAEHTPGGITLTKKPGEKIMKFTSGEFAIVQSSEVMNYR